MAGGGIQVKISYHSPGGRSRTLTDWVNSYTKNLPPKVFKPAIKDASRRTMMKTRTRAVRRVAAATRVPAKVARNRTRNIKGSIFGVRGVVMGLSFYSRGVSLPALKAKQTKKGVRAGKHFFEGAFIGTSSLNRQTHGFKREGAARLPVKALKVQFKGIDSVRQVMRVYSRTFLPRRFLSQVKYRSKMLGAT